MLLTKSCLMSLRFLVEELVAPTLSLSLNQLIQTMAAEDER